MIPPAASPPKCLRIRSATEQQAVFTKGLRSPEGGWTQESYLALQTAFTAAVLTISLTARAEAGRKFAQWVAGWMQQQVDQICAEARKAHFEGMDADHQHQLWTRMIHRVIDVRADFQLVEKSIPFYQSVIAQATSRIGALLGNDQPKSSPVAQQIAVEARGLASQVTRINSTTRDRLERVIRDTIAGGGNVLDVIGAIAEQIPEINARRAATIGRTETQRAWDQGTIRAIKANRRVLEVSVIGCMAREPNSPQYNGQSTCNIVGVPVRDIDRLVFHPNHTGTIVPSKFVGPSSPPPAPAPVPPTPAAPTSAPSTPAGTPSTPSTQPVPPTPTPAVDPQQAETNRKATPKIYEDGVNRLPTVIRSSPNYPSVVVNPAERTSVYTSSGNVIRMSTADDYRANEAFVHKMGHWTAHEYKIVLDHGTRADFLAAIASGRRDLRAAPEWARATASGFFAFRDAALALVGDHYAKTDAQRIQFDVTEALNLIAGLTSGAYGAGHARAYYRRYNNAAKEVFASAFTGSVLLGNNAIIMALFPDLARWMNQFTESLQ